MCCSLLWLVTRRERSAFRDASGTTFPGCGNRQNLCHPFQQHRYDSVLYRVYQKALLKLQRRGTSRLFHSLAPHQIIDNSSDTSLNGC